ncbi:hypothetical protein [Sciscionella sediminilitoris]|uniref:hypothetical protein n=1 Tax=Sciscionella sediminilitoris TaxID=1445613 RepID=UPI00056A56D6|nr:hypothetical protein [Sciscionella sp. SE31]
MDQKLLTDLISIPLFTGVIGYVTNWSGVLMLFAPLRFHGVRMPGLRLLYPFLPRRVQVIPAIDEEGRFGWQGIVPSRAAKMASIAVDKSLAKVGGIRDFYRELEPDTIAEHLITVARAEIRDVVNRIMEQEEPQLWHDLPPVVRVAVYRRVDQQLPKILKRLTKDIGDNIEQLVDAKLMVIRYLSEHPALLNDIFRNMGRKELRFMQNFGFYFGFPMGFALVAVVHALPYWWVLPIGGVIIGYIANYVGIMMIFEPVYPNRLVPWRQGLFIKRKAEISEEYAKTIAEDVITLRNVGDELLHGPRSDRTRALLASALRPAIDDAIGPARAAAEAAIGPTRFRRIRSSMAEEASEFAPLVFSDDALNRSQSGKIRRFVAMRMHQLDLSDFNELLRSAIKQDEWLLFVHGAVLGFAAGLVHLAIFGV